MGYYKEMSELPSGWVKGSRATEGAGAQCVTERGKLKQGDTSLRKIDFHTTQTHMLSPEDT